jgi:hypothetical protein
MKRPNSFWFGALLVGSTGLVYCGGATTDSTPPGGSAGSGITSSGAGGGRATGSVTTGAAGAPTTTTGTGGPGGAGGVGTGGGRPADAGACPRQMPNNGGNCAPAGDVCDYTGFACTCAPVGMTRDGGTRDGWMCVRVRPDAGAPGGGNGADASACPRNAPANASRCTAVGEVCPYAIETCTCEMAGGGMGDRWACAITIIRRDAGARGDGG